MEVMFDNFPADFDEPGYKSVWAGSFIWIHICNGFLISFLEIGSVRIKLSSMEILASMRLRMSLEIASWAVGSSV